jgi:hypothetical protein
MSFESFTKILPLNSRPSPRKKLAFFSRDLRVDSKIDNVNARSFLFLAIGTFQLNQLLNDFID